MRWWAGPAINVPSRPAVYPFAEGESVDGAAGGDQGHAFTLKISV